MATSSTSSPPPQSDKPYSGHPEVEPELVSPQRSLVGSVIAGVAALGAVLYLVNMGFGVVEILPDNIPFFGNIDEAGATAILIAAARYFGYDILPFTSFLHLVPKRQVDRPQYRDANVK